MSLFGNQLNFIRVASTSPELRVADVDFNRTQILTAMDEATSRGASIILFPELSLTSSTCADLFTQSLRSEERRVGKECRSRWSR